MPPKNKVGLSPTGTFATDWGLHTTTQANISHTWAETSYNQEL